MQSPNCIDRQVRELELNLKDADFVTKRLQVDKDDVVRTADKEMGEAKVSKKRWFVWFSDVKSIWETFRSKMAV